MNIKIKLLFILIICQLFMTCYIFSQTTMARFMFDRDGASFLSLTDKRILLDVMAYTGKDRKLTKEMIIGYEADRDRHYLTMPFLFPEILFSITILGSLQILFYKGKYHNLILLALAFIGLIVPFGIIYQIYWLWNHSFCFFPIEQLGFFLLREKIFIYPGLLSYSMAIAPPIIAFGYCLSKNKSFGLCFLAWSLSSAFIFAGFTLFDIQMCLWRENWTYFLLGICDAGWLPSNLLYFVVSFISVWLGFSLYRCECKTSPPEQYKTEKTSQ